MNNQRDLHAFSLKLCHYLSEFVVGSEKVVKYRRHFYKCFDDCLKGDGVECISSGSKAEGLDLPGSDLDLMILYKDFVVGEKLGDEEGGSFILDTDNASNGFALIKVSKKHSNYMNVTNTVLGFLLKNDGDKDVFCREFKSISSLIKCQGPSIAASIKGAFDIDMVVCYSCREWPSVAKWWIRRNRSNGWPSNNLIEEAINQGVLLVPVGSKSSSGIENCFEWRLSFSLTEKMLIHSFNYCQLLCYALLKIYLKEIIEEFVMFQKVLCSYYMKTIQFWILEEVDHSYWTPGNLMCCFQLCIQRLHYFLVCDNIPNYFIPEHNMIEGKVSVKIRRKLKDCITKHLKGRLWEVLLSSASLNGLRFTMCHIPTPLQVISDFDKTLMTLRLPDCSQLKFSVKKSLNFFVHRIQNENFPTYLKNIYAMALLDCSKNAAMSSKMHLIVSKYINNKDYYSTYKHCLVNLMLTLYRDSVSGWLLLAAFFYSSHEYIKMTAVLHLSDEILSRDLYCLPYWWNEPTIKQVRGYKIITQSTSFLKRLRHSLIKSVIETIDGDFFSHEDLSPISKVFCIGTPKVFIRYLTFFKFYKEKNKKRVTSAFHLLREAVNSSTCPDEWTVLINYLFFVKAQSLIGVQTFEEILKPFQIMIENLESVGDTGFCSFLKQVKDAQIKT